MVSIAYLKNFLLNAKIQFNVSDDVIGFFGLGDQGKLSWLLAFLASLAFLGLGDSWLFFATLGFHWPGLLEELLEGLLEGLLRGNMP